MNLDDTKTMIKIKILIYISVKKIIKIKSQYQYRLGKITKFSSEAVAIFFFKIKSWSHQFQNPANEYEQEDREVEKRNLTIQNWGSKEKRKSDNILKSKFYKREILIAF